ncbi:MAG: 50S ribosomal protein L18 [Gammaproteobacteria bacterium]|nr:50S ribosomal protein L18 [Gammaproteobacteria bacterium]
MTISKNEGRIRRAARGRAKIKSLDMHRLSVHRTPRHIYAQVFAPGSFNVVASASTVGKAMRGQLGGGGNVAAAAAVGKLIAERARSAGISRVAFDRSGYKYHGRIKALADAARESGLEF